jgi:DNA mismatch endonuclease (patch repair protein)
MADVLTPESRSYCMSQIRGANTKPELQIRRLLFAYGFRYRLNVATLPGKPDLVFRRYRAVIFAHGCFWHGHGCHMFKVPETNQRFWLTKIRKNRLNDARVRRALRKKGWRILTIWECALRGKRKLDPSTIASLAASWIRSESGSATIRGSLKHHQRVCRP